MITWTFVLFATAMCFTPGPNNLLLTTSGMRSGFWRSQPHVFGVVLGFFSLLTFSGLGLAVLLKAYPWLDAFIKVLGCLFLFYLSCKIAFSRPKANPGDSGEECRITFGKAFAFQFVNPKGLLMALSVQGNFFPTEPTLADTLKFAAVLGLGVGHLSAQTYVSLGAFIGGRTKRPETQVRVNFFMGIVLGLLTIYLACDNFLPWFKGLS